MASQLLTTEVFVHATQRGANHVTQRFLVNSSPSTQSLLDVILNLKS
jgi:hypothetical protein